MYKRQTITCEPNTNPTIDNKTVVEYIISKSKTFSLVNIMPYGSVSIGCKGDELTDIGSMYRGGIIGLSDGGESIENANFLKMCIRDSC